VGDDAREIVLADGSDAVVLERQPVTAHLAGVPSPAGGEADEGDDADLELDELEGELERLVLADNEDDE